MLRKGRPEEQHAWTLRPDDPRQQERRLVWFGWKRQNPQVPQSPTAQHDHRCQEPEVLSTENKFVA